jgi:putative transposase
MRYSATEKLEIIRLVDASYLGVRRTLVKLGIPKTTFYRWYERYQLEGVESTNHQNHPTSGTVSLMKCAKIL